MTDDDSLVDFFRRLSSELKSDPPRYPHATSDVESARTILTRLNEYFYQSHRGIGDTVFNGEELTYFSEFHKYWEKHHEEILGLFIDRDQTRVTATCLSQAIRQYGRGILEVTHDTHGLPKEAVAQVRFLTANQDFRVPPDEAYQKYLDDPTIFDPQEVSENPEVLLKALKADRLSQTDKRLDFARNSAKFLVDNSINAYQLAAHLGGDAVKIRDGLVAVPNMGYGQKKANMFVRDMVEMGVWPELSNFEGIEVASDINTMKVALRTGILKSKIPLVSSFLDIFGYQYGSVDGMSASAWRAVWSDWRDMDASTAPASPSQMDFLVYRIGREYCKDFVTEYGCPRGHLFLHFGGSLRLCRICSVKGTRSEAHVLRRVLPCQVKPEDLPHVGDALLLDSHNLLSTFRGLCIFEASCNPKNPMFRPYNPPKSISVIGQTGWTNSYADRDVGGGGMMG